MEKWLVVILFLLLNLATLAARAQLKEERFVVEVGVSVCVDKIPNCAVYTVTICFEIHYRLWALDVCAKFCNFCNITVPHEAVTSRRGTRHVGKTGLESLNDMNGCLYKDQIYQEGTFWNDGCDYTCLCLDGRSGLYYCKRSECTAVNSSHLSRRSSRSARILVYNILTRIQQRLSNKRFT